MIRLYKILAVFFFIMSSINISHAQNELYNAGGTVFLNSGAASSTPTLYVNGNITNDYGLFTNSGSYLEIKGDFTNYSSIPDSYYGSQDGAIERFSGTTEQAIKGNWNDYYIYNQFYNLRVFKGGGLSGNNKYLTLHTDVKINPGGSIVFESDPDISNDAIIRTDNATTSPSDPESYQFTLFLQNPDPTSISGYSSMAANGSAPVTSKYIEGKFKRQVATTDGVYDFPVGLRPDLKDGMEPFSLAFDLLPISVGITGYIRGGSVNVVYPNVLCDVGTPDPANPDHQFPTCAGGSDGIYDLYYLDEDLTHEWIATPDNPEPILFNYHITLYPGPILDPFTYYAIPAPCDATYTGKRLRVVAKDGVVGGTVQIGPGNYPPFAHLTSYLWCDFDDATLPITLDNQESFSSFRIHGTSNFSGTVLPVELVKFYLEPINNEYFSIKWQTASELNNAGFFLERSEDGVTFENIAWIEGNGTTSVAHDYNFEDTDVDNNKTYYYRLKQVDFDHSFKNTYVISGKLADESYTFEVISINPNPTTDNTQARISTPDRGMLQVIIYDMYGQAVKDNSEELDKGISTIQIDVTNLPSTTYMIVFNYGNKTITKKIIKK